MPYSIDRGGRGIRAVRRKEYVMLNGLKGQPEFASYEEYMSHSQCLICDICFFKYQGGRFCVYGNAVSLLWHTIKRMYIYILWCKSMYFRSTVKAMWICFSPISIFISTVLYNCCSFYSVSFLHHRIDLLNWFIHSNSLEYNSGQILLCEIIDLLKLLFWALLFK